MYVGDIGAAAIEGTCGCQCLNSLPVHLDPLAAVPAPGLMPLQRGAGNIVIGVVGTLFQVSASLVMRIGTIGKGSIPHAQILSSFHLQRSSILWSIATSLRRLPAIYPARWWTRIARISAFGALESPSTILWNFLRMRGAYSAARRWVYVVDRYAVTPANF